MKRDDIIETALKMFAEHGFAATSTANLAKAAGVAEGTIFRLFSGKEEIFFEIIAGLHRYIVKDFEATVAKQSTETGLEEITGAVRSFLVFVTENKEYFAIFFNEAPARYLEEDNAVFKEIRSIYAYISNFFSKNILRGQQDGSIRKNVQVEQTAAIMTCTVVGMSRARHFGIIPGDIAYTEVLIEGIINNLAA